MPTKGAASRLAYIDNIRWVLIVLVIVVHAGVTYGSVGSWFYTDDPDGTDAADILLTLINLLIQAFSMGLFFMIAGYFAAGSLDRKRAGRFLSDRAVRLGIPALIFMLVLAPAITYPLYIHGHQSLTDYLGWYLPRPWEWDSGPLWFAIALLVFCAIYALARDSFDADRFKGPLSRTRVAVLIGLVAAITFVVRLAYPLGTSVLNMQLSYFTHYIALFILGIMAYRLGWLESLTAADGRFWRNIAIASFFAILLPGMAIGISGDEGMDVFMGGPHWQAALLVVWEQIFGIGVCIWLIVWFRERFSRQSALQKKMSDNAFAAYVFHAPVLVALAVALHPLDVTNIVKYPILIAAGVAVTFSLSEFVIRRIPGLRDIL